MGAIRSTNQPTGQPAVHRMPYAIAPEVEAVLANWGRWAARRVGRPGAHTNPQFRQALRGRAWQPCATGASAVLDVEQAWAAEQVITQPLFSPRFRALLVQHYVHEARPGTTCRLLGILPLAYEAELHKAAAHFWLRWGRLGDVAGGVAGGVVGGRTNGIDAANMSRQ